MQGVAGSIIVGSIIFTLLVFFIFLLLLYLNRRALRHKEEMQAMERAKQRALLEATFEAQEKERKRIGSDIHDDIGPLLSTVKLQMNRFKTLREPTDIQQHITKVNQCLDEAIQMVRTVARDLTPVVLNEFGLIVALEDLCDRINQSNEIQAKLLIIGQERELAPQAELALYRIIQELCNNVIRHAAANSLQIIFEFTPAVLQVCVQDDGKGLPTANHVMSLQEFPQGIGLRNIEARSSILGATVQFESAKNQGTAATFDIPLSEQILIRPEVAAVS